MKKLSILFFLAIYMVSYAQKNDFEKHRQKSNTTEVNDSNTSLLRLIVTPEKYHNKTVKIIGYLDTKSEGNVLYSYKQDSENDASKNGVLVSFNDNTKQELEKYNQKYVTIIGKFDMNSKGNSGLFGGSLKEISILENKTL